MPPADPTPPLTERDLAELRIIASADVAFGLPHGPLLRRLVKEHAALTAQLMAQLDAYEHLAENNQDALDALRVAEQQLAQRTAERDAEQRAHERIATLCHEAGITNPDGTSVGVVRAAISALAERTAEREPKTAREHERGCPGLQAWDVPGACQCERPAVTRCGVCGSRLAAPTEG